jgi:hypothetical protein
MRYREINLPTRVAGILWAMVSLIAAGAGVLAAWQGVSDPQGSNPTQLIYGGFVLVVMGGLSTAFGAALAFEREPRIWRVGASWMGLRSNAKGILFFLTFFTAGLVLFGAMLVPGVIPWSAGGVVISLASSAGGAWGLRAIFEKRRRQRERSLKAAKKVAEARERRRAAKRDRP